MTNRDFIISLFEKYNTLQESNIEVYKHFEEARELGLIPIEMEKESWKRNVRNIRLQLVKDNYFDEKADSQDVIDHNRSLLKKNQKLQDLNRVERKTFRETARVENALEELNIKLIELLEKNNLKDFTKKHKVTKSSKKHYAVCQISDAHFNELIRPTTSIQNEYDFVIAGKRLKKLANNVKDYCKVKNVKNLVIAFTGDLVNSSRRRDELLSQSTNRVSAVLLGVYLLEQFIIDLNSEFNISIASVVGNESRTEDEYVFSEIISTENYDHQIHGILKMLFRGAKGINFIEGSYIEKVISLGNFNMLMLHGDKLKGSKIEKEVQSKIGKYAQRGVVIDHVIYGHLHSCMIGDLFSRSSSICGSNAYSEEGLNLISRASQNLYIIDSESKSLDGIKIDLQDTTDIVGYDIKKELEAYNAKSSEKLHDNKVILQIVV